MAEDLRVKLLAALGRRQRPRARRFASGAATDLRAHVSRRAGICLEAFGRARSRSKTACGAGSFARGSSSKRVNLAFASRATPRGAHRHRRRSLGAELEALAAAFEPRARFTGQIPRGDALALIADAHKLVHFSEAEGAPTVIREARALGVPVLATPVGDVARWADKDPGIEIFRPGPTELSLTLDPHWPQACR